MLVRYLPRESALVAAMNDGQPVWDSTEHLLADLWALLVRINSDPKKAPSDLDHPVREAMTKKARAESKAKLKKMFLERKNLYTNDSGR